MNRESGIFRNNSVCNNFCKNRVTCIPNQLLYKIYYVPCSSSLHASKCCWQQSCMLMSPTSCIWERDTRQVPGTDTISHNNWAGLVHASRGYLKPQKCFWYMMGWRWVNGVPRLGKLYGELPQTSLTLLQPDETRVTILLKDTSDPDKKLGIYTCPGSDFTYHVSQCCIVGLENAATLSARKLPPRVAWMGTWYQLCPTLIYGAITITHSPKKPEETFQFIWYKLPPSLKVNRHITKEFRMLLTMFQGLGLPNPNIDVLSWKSLHR